MQQWTLGSCRESLIASSCPSPTFFSVSEKPDVLARPHCEFLLNWRFCQALHTPSFSTLRQGASLSLLIWDSQGLQCSCAQPSSKPNECMEELLIYGSHRKHRRAIEHPPLPEALLSPSGAPISNSLTAATALRLALQGPCLLFSLHCSGWDPGNNIGWELVWLTCS